MKIAALITWLITAAGGFYLLGTWLARGGVRQQQARVTRFRAPVIFGHFLLAAAGLVVWLIYVAVDKRPLAWAAFIILLPVALLGFTMFARWIGVYRGTGGGTAAAALRPMASGGTRTATATAATGTVPAERHLPVAVVVAHGLLAATTLVLVLLTALGIGGQLRFFEHVQAGTPARRRVQRLLDATVWPLLNGGCHTGRDAAAAITRAGFVITHLDRLSRADTQIPFPAAPQILGTAIRPLSPGGSA